MMNDRIHLYNLIKESFLLLDFGDRSFFEQYGLTVPRYYALYHIATEPGLSPTRLSRRMFCDKSNVSRLLRSLEADGYIERRPHAQDARLHCLHLTPAGRQVQEKTQLAHHTFIHRRLADLTTTQISHLSSALAELANRLDIELDRTSTQPAA